MRDGFSCRSTRHPALGSFLCSIDRQILESHLQEDEMCKRSLCWQITMMVLVALLASSGFAATIDTISYTRYGAIGTSSTSQQVICQSTGVNLGTISLTFGAASFRFTNTAAHQSTTLFGETIKGGFNESAAATAAGMKFYWIQADIGSPTLYPWESPTKWAYDRTRVSKAVDPQQKEIADGSPFYANARGPAYGYDLGFYDAPQDYLKVRGSDPTDGATDINFTFNTALVCVMGNTISILDGFSWSYHWNIVNGQANYYGGSFTDLTYPSQFANIVAAWNNDPDQADLGDKWTLVNNGTCCGAPAPLPVSADMGLALIAVTLLASIRASIKK
jgi:hypothetical protein